MTSRRPRAVLGVASVAVALAAADTYVVVLALTDMMAGVGISIDALQRATPIITGFLLGYIATLPLIGRIADLIARQRVLQICLAIFVVGSAITALAVDLHVLVIGRVLQGIGGGGLVPATLALVADLWPADRRGLPLGVVGAVQEIGSVLGPLLGAAILVVSGWRAIFWANAVAGLLLSVTLALTAGERFGRPRGIPALVGALGLALLGLALWAPGSLVTDVSWGVPFVPVASIDSRLATPVGLVALVMCLTGLGYAVRRALPVLSRSDVPGAVLLGGALGCVIVTFASADPAREVVGPTGWVLLLLAAVLGVAYLWRHRTAPVPLIARDVVRNRVRGALVVSLFVGAALVAVVVTVPTLARMTIEDADAASTLHLLKFLVAVPVGAVVGGWALRHLGAGLVSAVGMALAAAALFVAATWGRGSIEAAASWAVLVAAGFGMGLALAPVNDAALADAPEEAHGTVSALVVVARMVGMVVGLALLTAIGLHQYYDHVATLPDQSDVNALLEAGLVQVRARFFGAAVSSALAALVSLTLGLRRVTGRASTGSLTHSMI